MSFRIGIIILMLLFADSASLAWGETWDEKESRLYYPLQIFTQKQELHDFRVEYPRNGAEKQKGLMYRTYLQNDAGMLFHYRRPQYVQMWMKNTYIPLDMVFIVPLSDAEIQKLRDEIQNRGDADDFICPRLRKERHCHYGKIEMIEARTEPHSLNPVGAERKVIAVLELAGGQAASRIIKNGDRVLWYLGDSLP